MTLDSLYGLHDARIMDLYAGSGAIGLEALSRGAAEAVLVESDPKAVRTIKANVQSLGLEGARVVADKVARVLAKTPDAPYDIVFADPPYAVPEAEVLTVLELLRDNGWLVQEGLVAFERESRGKALVWPEGYVEERVRRYGEASVWYGRAAGNP